MGWGGGCFGLVLFGVLFGFAFLMLVVVFLRVFGCWWFFFCCCFFLGGGVVVVVVAVVFVVVRFVKFFLIRFQRAHHVCVAKNTFTLPSLFLSLQLH